MSVCSNTYLAAKQAVHTLLCPLLLTLLHLTRQKANTSFLVGAQTRALQLSQPLLPSEATYMQRLIGQKLTQASVMACLSVFV